jgi:putative DNA methylase
VTTARVQRRKLAEVALPLDAMNAASAHEKNLRIGHPCSLHIWWSRKPLAVCRALVFAQLVDDPSSRPDLFPTEQEQARERERLFVLLGELSRWESRNDEGVLTQARSEIQRATDGNAPSVLDPFCGGGSVPLEAARLGVPAEAADLNPLATLLTIALAELPARFAHASSVFPSAQGTMEREHAGLSTDVRAYARRIRERAIERLAPFYPVAPGRGARREVHAWLWARTVTCPNPTCHAATPLVSKFLLSTQRGQKVWAQPIVEAGRIRYEVRSGNGEIPTATVGRNGAKCVVCAATIPLEHVRAEGMAGRLGAHLMALAVEGDSGREFLDPDPEHERIALAARPEWAPESDLPEHALGFRVMRYGLKQHRDLFTDRQLAALSTHVDLVRDARAEVEADARRAGLLPGDERPLRDGGTGARAYAEAVSVFLALALGKLTDYASTLCSWMQGQAKLGHTFVRQALAMSWDFAEGNPLSASTGGYRRQAELIARVLDDATVPAQAAHVIQHDAKKPHPTVARCVVITDPPYYDNIGYADLADYFYVWLRPILRDVYPDLFRTMLTPKEDELVAAAERFRGDRVRAQRFFEQGLGEAFTRLREIQHPDYPLTIFYAFKQSEASDDGVASTGWESMLEALLRSGFAVTGTWPMRTESMSRLRNLGSNALASSIALVCRPRADDAPRATRAEFLAELRADFPAAMRRLQQGHVAPVDLAQAAIGPGIALFSRYAEVVEADGRPMTVRSALSLINQLLDEHLSAQEADLDAPTRFAVTWFETYGFEPGAYGDAETLAKARVVSVARIAEDGLVASSGGKVRLLRRGEVHLEHVSDATPAWLALVAIAHRLLDIGEAAAADLVRPLNAMRPTIRALAYRLYAVADRKKWSEEAQAFNALAVAWPELEQLAAGTTATMQVEIKTEVYKPEDE